ncbi:MAG: helix-turn-helix transcriptional regulator [Rudaea sp.]
MTALDDEAPDRSRQEVGNPASHSGAWHPRFAGHAGRTAASDESGLTLELTPCDQILRKTRMVALGRHRCGVDHLRFARGGGPLACAQIAFRRTSVRLRVGAASAEVVSPNHVTFHNPGESYARDAISAEGDDYDWLALSPAFVRNVLRQSPRSAAYGLPSRIFAQTVTTIRPELFVAQRRLFAAVRQQPGLWNCEQVESAIAGLVRCLVADHSGSSALHWRRRRHPRPTCHERQVHLVEEAKAILGREFSSEITLVDLAQRLHCSPANLSRVFHAATSMRLNDYRLELRLRKGVALLEESGLGIGDIGVHVGFASHSHFTSAFHQHFGMNPSQFLRVRPQRLDALLPVDPDSAPMPSAGFAGAHAWG